MKTILFLFILINTYAFSQCPQSGLKIQSKDCGEPKGLAVANIGCAEMKIKWIGNSDQTFIVNANYANSKSGEMTVARVSDISNENGTCTAIIEAEEGSTIKWNIQAICKGKGAKVYSPPVTGPDTYIPMCRREKESTLLKGFAVYPNPSKGSLMVEYTGKTESSIMLNIFDINGKKVFSQNQNAISNTMNQYKLDLHDLPPGTYMLEVVNGSETKQNKFVMLRE